MSAVPRTAEWVGGGAPAERVDGFLRLLDQTRLPGEVAFRDCRTAADVWEAIRSLRVRGAPAIGVAAAFGVVVGLLERQTVNVAAFRDRVREVADYLRTSRPTAVNLFWALDRMVRKADRLAEPFDRVAAVTALLAEARAIQDEDAAMSRAIGRHGAALVSDGGVLTHCNAGGLATAEYGTALAVVYAAADAGRRLRVYVDETRPLLQGARLTAWELLRHGLDVTLICDNMAAQVMREGKINMVVVGADRIAANGDTANKIGTYGVALLAHAHGIPFYVAAPSSTFDLSLSSGEHIPIEQRDPREVTHGFGSATAPAGIQVYNPAFDVTPARLIAGIITERGVIRPVTDAAIREMLAAPPA
ncbi:MAG TPA: S-methyl-5-thioribose-1-phosphate isomerase [Gemmataceae bacterium]|jgi:methylthioribose-1-phosphate isomerase